MADNCALPKMAGRLNFPYQAIAFFEIVSSTLIKKGITATLKTLCHLLISRAGSWYFFTFSTSVVRIFSFTGTAMSISVHSCNYVFMYNSRIWTIVLQLLVCKDSHIPSYPHFSILCNWQGWWSYHLLVHCNPYFLHSSQCTRRATILWPSPYSFWASVHWQYVILLYWWIHCTICTAVSQMSYLRCAWPSLFSMHIIAYCYSQSLLFLLKVPLCLIL